MALTKVTQHSLGNSAVTTAKLGTAPFGFANSSANVVYMAANGNVGIGTSAPIGKLHVSTASASAAALILNSSNDTPYLRFDHSDASKFTIGESSIVGGGGTGYYDFYATTSTGQRFFTGAAERMRIVSTGQLGVGITAPASYGAIATKSSSTLILADDATYALSLSEATTLSKRLILGYYPTGGTASNGYGVIQAVNSGNTWTDIVMVPNGGQLIVGGARTSARGLVDIPTVGGTGSVSLAVSRGGDAGAMVNFYSTNSSTTVVGNIYMTGGTNTLYNTSSDYRLKRDIAPMTGALSKVALLKPCTYVWKSTGAAGQGFIAHELQEVIPDAVTGEKDAVDEDGNVQSQSIDTSYLVATLTAAIQELKAEFDAYKASHP